MKIYSYIIPLFIIVIFSQTVFADDIIIDNFNELITSTPVSGDILRFTNSLNSSSSIGEHFLDLSITFDGNNHSIDGNNTFSGFTFNEETLFNQLDIKNCKGQTYGAYSYAGAIFNEVGSLKINDSIFQNNFIDSNGLNIGSGGAIYNITGGNVSINNTLFENNYTDGASSYGGAIANDNTRGEGTVMTIDNSAFKNNYSEGSVLPYGGAIYNSGKLDINNTSFDNNKTFGEESYASYGGAIYNLGEININNSSITNNHSDGDEMTIVRGGAIYNNGSLVIDNSDISNNYVNSQLYGDGGAIFNNTDGTVTIKNSLLENNRINQSQAGSEGGAVANIGTLIIENSTFRNNLKSDTNPNDIHNYPNGKIIFNGSGTTNILSGITGSGEIYKESSGTLNLGGTNNNFIGSFIVNGGTVNIMPESRYFSAQNTTFGNNINFNLQNNEIDNINFGNLNLNGKANIYADVNLNTNIADRINAASVSGSGSLNLARITLEGTPKEAFVSIPFADSVLKDYVNYSPSSIQTPIYDYSSSYNSANGNLVFRREGFNSSAYIPAVAAQLAGYLTEIETYKNVFSNLDMVMIESQTWGKSLSFANKTADSNGRFAFSPNLIPEQRGGVWVKPYSYFEKVQLKNGPDVSNVSYGSILGLESPLVELKKEWYGLYGAYVSYNGSHQAFSGNSIYNNGGLFGLNAVFYKGNFFTAWTANAGANSAEASTFWGKDNFAMLNAGIAQKTGYNFETLKKKLIIQPSIMLSYTFVNTFNYTTSADVSINANPLHAIHIEPQIKLIGNLKNYLQPYISVSMIWNVIDKTNFQVNDVYLPQLSVKPYVQYGVGIQKRWGDRITGFFETMIRNGGRNGVALQMGLRISI